MKIKNKIKFFRLTGSEMISPVLSDMLDMLLQSPMQSRLFFGPFQFFQSQLPTTLFLFLATDIKPSRNSCGHPTAPVATAPPGMLFVSLPRALAQAPGTGKGEELERLLDSELGRPRWTGDGMASVPPRRLHWPWPCARRRSWVVHGAARVFCKGGARVCADRASVVVNDGDQSNAPVSFVSRPPSCALSSSSAP